MTHAAQISRAICCAAGCGQPDDCLADEFAPFVRRVLDAEHAILESPENVERLARVLQREFLPIFADTINLSEPDADRIIRAILAKMREIGA